MKTKKQTVRKPKLKRGPKEERLIIRDPQKAVDSLFKPKPKPEKV
ncbi:MAG TPA: hypothetical protein VMD55_09210 [Terracidiphilus sp.]|nr:hypothetical protein [Terracidiphilus sp.]